MGWIYKYKDDNVVIEISESKIVTYIFLRNECNIDKLIESLQKAKQEMGNFADITMRD